MGGLKTPSPDLTYEFTVSRHEYTVTLYPQDNEYHLHILFENGL